MENRKTQIIELALDLIREKGYVAFSYDDISKQLGVTKASIHYHFERKEDLAVAVTDRIHQTLKSLMQSVKNEDVPTEEKIKNLINKQLKLSGKGICPISSLQTDFESIPEVVQLRVRELSQFELTGWMELLGQAQVEGIVKSFVDIEALAYAVLSCIKGSLQYKRVLEKDITPQIMEQIVRMVKR
ncbi:TetR/AcrR family transcriptional regulator [Paenibacillus qinlingensis]|uniref:TetR/AcrR family transcriptional repressor of nem operon n=1 Tax=Paenibacillus qinlingensis TaxID=1837343 RepID=A0ABU1NRN5_9BACL|nr:TetR/AcrR family transcriptional regulator [Paenibacillus qinlingensis]MDR6550115.1 TetR/AcrR family transcriptional repressor of nem operon [Paenibacillus qinlingensis]